MGKTSAAPFTAKGRVSSMAANRRLTASHGAHAAPCPSPNDSHPAKLSQLRRVEIGFWAAVSARGAYGEVMVKLSNVAVVNCPSSCADTARPT